MALILNGSTGVSLVQPGALPNGSVIQVVTATNSTRFITNSTSFVGTNLQCSITPSSATNKIFAVVSSNINNNNTGGHTIYYTLFRGSTNLGDATQGFGINDGVSNIRVQSSMAMSVLDSPSTTSAVTYRVHVRMSNTAANGEIPSTQPGFETITLLEIAA
jgi:hypothetical protein